MKDENQEILEVNQAFYRAFEKRDIIALHGILSQGISTVCIHPGRGAICGFENIRNSWDLIFKNTFLNSPSSLDVFIIAPTLY